MTETLASTLAELFKGGGKEVAIFIISLLPILELRGGLIAARILGVEFIKAFIICYIANIIPVPFILLFINWIFNKMSKWKPTKKIVDWLSNKTLKKKEQIDKYGYFGLFLFVSIPLPGTGAWTGSLLAILLNLDKKKSFITIAIGVLAAGIIMSLLSYGIF